MTEQPKEVPIAIVAMEDGRIILELPGGGYEINELERIIANAKLAMADTRGMMLN